LNITLYKNIDKLQDRLIPCYIIHYTKNVDRLNFLKKQIFPTLIESSLFSEITLITEFDKQNKFIKSISKNSLLTRAEISCTKKHFSAWEQFYKTEKNYCLILEDDILFEERIESSMEEQIKELSLLFSKIKKSYNYITIGAGLHKHGDKGKDFTPRKYGRSPDSYIISREFLNYHKENLFNNDLPIGFYIDKILSENGDFLWWYEPTIFRQGTHNNIYKSNISRFYRLKKFFNL